MNLALMNGRQLVVVSKTAPTDEVMVSVPYP